MKVIKKLFFGLLFIAVSTVLSAASPRRIVALSPSSAEILCAIGAYNQIVARTDVCDYPPEILEKPVCGGFDGKSLSLETIVSYNPDLVYLTKGMHDHLEKPLNQLGIKTYMSVGSGVQGVLDEILEVGKLTGHTKEAKKVVAGIEAEFDLIKKTSPSLGSVSGKSSSSNTGNLGASANTSNTENSGVGVYWEVWYAPYMSSGGGTFINDIIEKACGKNIFADVNDPYPIVSEESIIAAMPEVIIIPASEGVTPDDVKKRDGWAIIPAVKNGKIFIVDDNLFTRPGPRIGKVASALAQLINKNYEL